MSADQNGQESTPSVPTVDDVRASGWEDVVSAIDTDDFGVAELGLAFWHAAEAAEVPNTARVFQLFAAATSASLDVESWNEPFTPFMTLGEKRSVIPSDLNPAEIAFLCEAAELVSSTHCFQARLFDIGWTYGTPGRSSTRLKPSTRISLSR